MRSLLEWLDQPEVLAGRLGPTEWQAFVEVCKFQLAFNPQTEGVLTGAARLAEHEGPWKAVWERFCEAPKRYLRISGQIRKCPPPNNTLFWHISDGSNDGWPQWNQEQEQSLHRDLMAIDRLTPQQARNRLLELEKQHGRRRQLVWAQLGEAPRALALEHRKNISIC